MCPICSSTNNKVLYHSRPRRGYSIVGCDLCGLQYIDPMLSSDEQQILYQADYFHAWGLGADINTGLDESYALVADMKRRTFRRYLHTIRQFCPGGGRLLEIGCAFGFFLEEASNFGYDVYGAELASDAANKAAAILGHQRVRQGDFQSLDYEPGSFDLIVMLDVIEHFNQPRDVLTKIYSLLAPGGYVFLVTPNTASFSRYVMGGRWMHYKLEHSVYFDKRSLRYLSDHIGFRRLEFRTARKSLNGHYLQHYASVYMTQYGGHLLPAMIGRLPLCIRRQSVALSLGEMFAILQK